MSNAIKHKSRSRVTYQNNSEIFRGFESRANTKKFFKDAKKSKSLFGGLSLRVKNMFRKNQGK